MYKYFHILFGYYEFQIRGKKTERLLNELNKNKIPFWAYKKLSDESGEYSVLKTTIFDAENLLEAAENSHLTATVYKKCGIPFIFERLIKRPGLFVGFFIGFILLYVTSLYIWEIQIPDIEGVSEGEITEALEECGIKIGTFMPEMNVAATENLFLLKNPQFSYISINMNGTVAKIILRRAVTPDSPIDKNGTYNVIASKSGIVEKVEAFEGTPKIEKGDVVNEGDILISGLTKGRYGTVRAVHARGEIEAWVTYSYSQDFMQEYSVKSYTGETKKKTSLILFGKSIDFFIDEKAPYDKCDAVSTSEIVKLFGVIKLPIIKETVEYKEFETVETVRSLEVTKATAQVDFQNWCEREIKGEITDILSITSYDEENKKFTLNATVTVLENIAVEREFSITDLGKEEIS